MLRIWLSFIDMKKSKSMRNNGQLGCPVIDALDAPLAGTLAVFCVMLQTFPCSDESDIMADDIPFDDGNINYRSL